MTPKTLACALPFTLALLLGVARDAAAADDDATAAAARAVERSTHPRLSVFTTLGYLGSPGGSGTAFATGLRLAVGRHFTAGFDLGYGVLAMQSTFQDRWWIMPSLALVLPARIAGRDATFDLGAGLGLGATSGYASLSTFVNAPFDPVWAFQLVPAVRLHAVAALRASRGLELFGRVEAGALVLPEGSRASSFGVADTTWLMLSLGARFGLL